MKRIDKNNLKIFAHAVDITGQKFFGMLKTLLLYGYNINDYIDNINDYNIFWEKITNLYNEIKEKD